MRLTVVAVAAVVWSIPAAAPVQAHPGNVIEHQAFASAANKKKKAKPKTEQYMRAVPSR